MSAGVVGCMSVLFPVMMIMIMIDDMRYAMMIL